MNPVRHGGEERPSVLETIVDKFVFRVATDRWYSAEGAWALPAGEHVRVGVSDFVQQHSGDVAFVEARAVGAVLARGDEVALVETIKANVEVASPLGGTVVGVNPALLGSPEVVNQDPYGEGWLVLVDARDWTADRAALLDPESYFELMREQAEAEVSQA
jgi:glycine cleavage system H protein